jgi:hypothetical protein
VKLFIQLLQAFLALPAGFKKIWDPRFLARNSDKSLKNQ